MIDQHPETARQRAARIWRNYQIQKSITTPEEPNITDEEANILTEAQLDRLQIQFRNEIRSVLRERHKKSLLHYLIMKRLKRKDTDNVK
jgi:FKBP-type peptidyl-prolyl cis-trans isomerase (trigger factor)